MIFCLFVSTLASCSFFKTEQKETALDPKLYPPTIGGFKKEKDLTLLKSAIYSDSEHNSITYTVKETPFKKDSFSVYGSGETLFDSPGVTISFDGENFYFNAHDSVKNIEGTANTASEINVWASQFPYADFGIQAPPQPIKIQLPPADFLKEHPAEEDDAKFKEAATKIIKLWLSGHKLSNPTVKTADFDKSSLVIKTGASNSEELANDLVKEDGGELRSFGYRQIFFDRKRYELPKDETKKTSSANTKKQT